MPATPTTAHEAAALLEEAIDMAVDGRYTDEKNGLHPPGAADAFHDACHAALALLIAR